MPKFSSFSGNFNIGGHLRASKAASVRLPVLDSLTFWIDAAKYASYPESGSTWYDLLGGTKNGTRTATPPTFTKAGSFSNFYMNGGGTGFSFDVYASAPRSNFSYELWARPQVGISLHGESTAYLTVSISGNSFVIGADNYGGNCGVGLSLGTNGYCVFEHANNYFSSVNTSGYSFSSTVPSHIVVSMSNNQSSVYVNGTFVRTGLTSGYGANAGTGSSIGYGSYGNYTGYVYLVRYYSKALTASEVTRNFNVERARFGV